MRSTDVRAYKIFTLVHVLKRRIPTYRGSTLALRLFGYHITLLCFLGIPVALIITKLLVLDYAYRSLAPRPA